MPVKAFTLTAFLFSDMRMDTRVNINFVNADNAAEIAQLAVCLTNEIIERTGTQHFDVDLPQTTVLCKRFLEEQRYRVLATWHGDKIIGFIALCESYALYTEGCFGIIQEFYVLPEYRRRKTGEALLRQAKHYARTQAWKRLELCTPPVEEFQNTVDFYLKQGFEITGGYKMKLPL